MAKIKTTKTKESVKDFLLKIEDKGKRQDSQIINDLMESIIGEKGSMWGSSIIGYGNYHYKYDSGREGDWMLTGFSPRKQALTIYIMTGFKKYDGLLKKLGKHKTGKSCLYIKKLEDIHMYILKDLITESVSFLKSKYA